MRPLPGLCKISIILLLTFATRSTIAQGSLKGFSIEGNIHGVKDRTIVKLFDLNQQLYLDSAYTHNGRFTLKGHVMMPTTCWLQCQDEYAIIQVENLNMEFDSPLKGMFSSYKAVGGKEQELQSNLNIYQRPYDRVYLSALDSLNNKLYNNDADEKRLIKVFTEAEDTSMKIYVDFGKRNINSYLGLDIIYRNRKTIPRDTVDFLYHTLTGTYKNTTEGKALEVFLYERLAEKGHLMVDFEARTITGEPFKLSSLRGKYVYLDFSSEGCGPCRMENRDISKNYDRISKLMTIVYFSLDKNMELWQKATKEDSIVWYNVSDMEGENGRIKTIYNVQAMPTAFLIDKNGVIVEKMEGYDDTQTLKNIEAIIQNTKE
jgi:peroxiredoxin